MMNFSQGPALPQQTSVSCPECHVHTLTGFKASTSGQYFSVSFHINPRVVVWSKAYVKRELCCCKPRNSRLTQIQPSKSGVCNLVQDWLAWLTSPFPIVSL